MPCAKLASDVANLAQLDLANFKLKKYLKACLKKQNKYTFLQLEVIDISILE